MLTKCGGSSTIRAHLFPDGSPMPSTALPSRFRQRAVRALQSPWLHPLNDTDALNELLALANPRWSLTEIRAEVIAREQQTADAVSFWLRPNRLWKGFRAGQHVTISVEINGVRHTRSEEHTSELQSLMRISYAVFCLKKKKKNKTTKHIEYNKRNDKVQHQGDRRKSQNRKKQYDS